MTTLFWILFGVAIAAYVVTESPIAGAAAVALMVAQLTSEMVASKRRLEKEREGEV